MQSTSYMLPDKLQLKDTLHQRRFLIMLLGLASLFLIPTSSQVGNSFQINPIAELLLLASTLIYVMHKPILLRWYCVVGLVIMIRTVIPLGDPQFERLIGLGYYLLLFIFICREVFRDLIQLKTVTLQEIYGALAGYILIGFGGSFANILINMFTTNPFCGLKEGQSIFDQLMYFSFSTLLTIGYGDIVPCNVYAAKFSMLLGILGQLYLAVAIAVLVGGFLMKKNETASKPV